MDPRLAELYGTNQPDEGDLEKMAAAEFAEGLTEDESIDLDGVDDETLEALAQEVLEGSDEETTEEGDEDMEKLSEADYLGRVMAHAYVNEMRGIEKLAKKGKKKAPKGPGMITKSKRFVVRHAKKADRKANKAFDKTLGRVGKAIASSGTAKDVKRGLSAAGRHIGRHRGLYAGGATLAAGGYAAKKAFEKRSSAFETLAEQRALEMLEESGTEETTQYDVLQAAVEQRAAEILEANGYEVAEIDE